MGSTNRVGASHRAAALLLAVLATGAFSACGSPKERTVEVRMHFSRYLPGTLDVRIGQTITFEVVNEDPIAHEFIIGTAAEHQDHERGDPNDPHDGPGEASIPANGTARVTYTFVRPGTLLYACHLPGHYAYGMRGEVRIS